MNNEELKVGCLLEYRGRTRCQSLFGRLCKLGVSEMEDSSFLSEISVKKTKGKLSLLYQHLQLSADF